MRRTRSFLLLVLLAALLGGGLYLAQEPAPVPPPAVVIAPVDRVEPTTPEPANLPAVRIEITTVGTFRRIPPVPVCRLVRRDGDPVEARVTWLAGGAAGVERDLAGDHLVALELVGGDRLFRVVRFAPGERSVDVEFGGPFTYSGQVVDLEGAPVAGARIWLAGRPEVVTNDTGEFEVDGLRSSSGLPLVIRAAGRADHYRVVRCTPPAAHRDTFALEPGCDLVVRASGTVPSEQPVAVHLRPPGGSGLPHHPFFWSAIARDEFVLDREGACRLSGLPRGQRIEVVLAAPTLRATTTSIELAEAIEEVAVPVIAESPIRGVLATAAGPVVLLADEAPPPPTAMLPLGAQLAGSGWGVVSPGEPLVFGRPLGARVTLFGDGVALTLPLHIRSDDLGAVELPPAERFTDAPQIVFRSARPVRVEVWRDGAKWRTVTADPSGSCPVADPALLDIVLPDDRRTRVALVGSFEIEL